MPEPLTSDLVGSLLKELHVAFPRNLGAQNPVMMADIYRNGLRGLSGDAVRWAVGTVIQEDSYFPKVARLRELAQRWQRTTTAVIPHRGEAADPDTCSVCGARAGPVEITRWKRKVIGEKSHEKWVMDLDDQGKPQWETVMSVGMVILHDRQRHGVS